MGISAKVEYACLAMIALAHHWPSRVPLQIGKIAEQKNIPMRFLTHILIQLKQLGLVESMRGKSGGYILTKPPQDIYLRDILGGFGGHQFSGGLHKIDGNLIALESVWKEIDTLVTEKLSEISLDQLSERVRNTNGALIYEI